MRSITNNVNSFRTRVLNRRILSVFSTLFFIALFFVLLSVNLAYASETSPVAPTLISITEGIETINPKPVITGLTFNDTQVDIFIDNQFNGEAIVRNSESGTANFYYYPPLLSAGKHTVHAIARKGANISQETPKVNFKVLGISSPTLFTPVFNIQTIESKPFIVGLVHNNSKVKIYIDDQYDGEIWVKNHPSGVANFAYKPKLDLAVGSHNIRAIAISNLTGQESNMSSMVTFMVKQPYPAPTLFKPTTKDATWFRPNISGLAKNGSYVEIYINDVKHRVDLDNNPSDVVNFTFRPEQDLRAGMNIIFAVAYSNNNKMSRKSNIIYWDLTPSGVSDVIEKEKPLITGESNTEQKVESDIEIDIKDRSGDAEVTIYEEDEFSAIDQTESSVIDSAEPVVSGESDVSEEIAETIEDIKAIEGAEEDDLEDSPNWSKIVGLIILAVLIITLIIQLLKKEEPEDKQGETLSLFEDGKDKGEDNKKEKSKSSEKAKEKKSDDIIPPPPPSSNLPF